MSSQKIEELLPALPHIGRVGDDGVALPAFLRQAQLAGLAATKLFERPTAPLLDSLEPQVFRCVNEHHGIAQPPPARFDQYGRVEEYGGLSRRFRLRDLSRDPPRDLRMNDLLQRVPRGAMRLTVTEHAARDRAALDFSRHVKDAVAKLPPESNLHALVEQGIMPETISINDVHVRQRSHFPRDGTLPRTNSAHHTNHRDASRGGHF